MCEIGKSKGLSVFIGTEIGFFNNLASNFTITEKFLAVDLQRYFTTNNTFSEKDSIPKIFCHSELYCHSEVSCLSELPKICFWIFDQDPTTLFTEMMLS